MTVEGRRLHVSSVVANRICDSLLDAYLDGDLTGDEANAELAKIAKFYHQEELIPLIKQKKDRLLKHRLKENKRKRDVSRQKTEPIPIPEPKSKAVVKPRTDGELLASILN